MENYTGTSKEMQIDSSELMIFVKDRNKKFFDRIEKEISNPQPLKFIDINAEKLIKSTAFIFPETYYSPKDKVSNLIWNNRFNCNEDRPVVTVKKSEDFGCIVQLNYDKIFADEHVITGANFSDFDRALYDAVVTLIVAGNNIFNNTALWRVIESRRQT